MGTDGTLRVFGACARPVGGSAISGTQIGLWACEPNDGSQQWHTGTDGSLVHKASGLCLAGGYTYAADTTTSGSDPTGLNWFGDAVANLGTAVGGFTDAFIGPIREAAGTFVQDMGDGMKNLSCPPTSSAWPELPPTQGQLVGNRYHRLRRRRRLGPAERGRGRRQTPETRAKGAGELPESQIGKLLGDNPRTAPSDQETATDQGGQVVVRRMEDGSA
ncbi:ricin-type beta-trefoil lectin domain protein [Kitasatospora sp. NPDC089509]|uniref:ricin-type beta-trefoil lectin domain protein n=1 Tax=Kitasatospora sp. NPDC089509 TaxID=3364079 RepID=UPI00382CAEFC